METAHEFISYTGLQQYCNSPIVSQNMIALLPWRRPMTRILWVVATDGVEPPLLPVKTLSWLSITAPKFLAMLTASWNSERQYSKLARIQLAPGLTNWQVARPVTWFHLCPNRFPIKISWSGPSKNLQKHFVCINEVISPRPSEEINATSIFAFRKCYTRHEQVSQ